MASVSDEKLKEFIQDQLGVEPSEIDDSACMWDLGADDLDMLELVMAVEDEVAGGREIPDEYDATNPTITYAEFKNRINKALAAM